MKIAILCDGLTLAAWQRDALQLIAPEHELVLLVVKQTRPAKRDFKKPLYYLLNIASMRPPVAARVPFPDASEIAITDRHELTPQYDGAWAVLPEDTIVWLRENGVDAIVKFALNLLRVPDASVLPMPILSYHHGDPRRFRGRPAGFYEMREGVTHLGQIVQILSNALDAGDVVAYGETRVRRESYRATLAAAYRLSPHLLPTALKNLRSSKMLPMERNGRNYRLPGNRAVVSHLIRSATAMARRFGYGVAMEKKWRVSTMEGADTASLDAFFASLEAPERWQPLAIPSRYTFYADPFFFGNDGTIAVEALERRSGKGRIVLVDSAGDREISGLPGHSSYPSSIEEAGERYLVPEIASWSRLQAYKLEHDCAIAAGELPIEADAIVDPTLFKHGGHFYLFGNLPGAPHLLELWVAETLFGGFSRHPASPIHVSERGVRMAGEVLELEDGLYRLGQDYRQGYGDGVLAYRIEELSADRYRETFVRAFSFADVQGPHTINLQGRRAVFDFYVDRFSPLAGVLRLRASLGRPTRS